MESIVDADGVSHTPVTASRPDDPRSPPSPAHGGASTADHPLSSSSPYVYLSSSTFHRVFHCRRTGSRVSYADVGARDGPLILFLPPSGCSRWMGVLMDGYARARGVRLLTPDRPGQGATPRCQLERRVEVATKQALSLLEHVCNVENGDIGEISLMTHSGGIYFLLPTYLALLGQGPDADPTLPRPSPRIFLLSPFVPTCVSGQRYFPLLPTTLVSSGYVILPPLLSASKVLVDTGRKLGTGWTTLKGAVGSAGSFSGSLLGSEVDEEEEMAAEAERRARLGEKKRKGMEEERRRRREKSERKYPTADLHPPFRSQARFKLRGDLFAAWAQRRMAGLDQDRPPQTSLSFPRPPSSTTSTTSAGSNGSSRPSKRASTTSISLSHSEAPSTAAKEFAVDLLSSFLHAEGMWGISQEHLLCLGRAKDGGQGKLVERIRGGFEDIAEAWRADRSGGITSGKGSTGHEGGGERSEGARLEVEIWWASGDGMIPKKGRDWLDDLLRSANLNDAICLIRHELGGGVAHDVPWNTRDVLGMAYDWVLKRQERSEDTDGGGGGDARPPL